MRQDDHEKKCYFRSSDRVFHSNGAWYFTTREGEEGPYPSEDQVQIEVQRFITARTELAQFQAKRELEAAASVAKSVHKLEVIMPDDRARIRPCEPVLAQRKVYM